MSTEGREEQDALPPSSLCLSGRAHTWLSTHTEALHERSATKSRVFVFNFFWGCLDARCRFQVRAI